jgi:hypothetical protein
MRSKNQMRSKARLPYSDLANGVDHIKNKQMGIGHCVIYVEFKRVPILAISQVKRVNKNSFIFWMASLSPMIVFILHLSDEPIADRLVGRFGEILPKLIVDRRPHDNFAHSTTIPS